MKELRSLPEEEFKRYFQKWQKSLEKFGSQTTQEKDLPKPSAAREHF